MRKSRFTEAQIVAGVKRRARRRAGSGDPAPFALVALQLAFQIHGWRRPQRLLITRLPGGRLRVTLVAACRFRNGAVILADSRATWLGGAPSNPAVEDTLRKVLHVGPKTALAYAGSAEVAQCVAKELRRRSRLGGRSGRIRKIALDFPRIAKHCFSLSTKRMATQFVLVGVDAVGEVSVWCGGSPQFKTVRVNHGFVVLGSGADAVRPFLEDKFTEIEASSPRLKDRADRLISALEAQLRNAGTATVGGLFQVITVAEDGIRPMTYGFTSMDPESPARSLSMEFVAGTWVQRIEATGQEVPLAEPSVLIGRGATGMVVQDLTPLPDSQQKGIWHLCYFITSQAGARDQHAIEFRGEWTSIGAKKYPVQLDGIAALGFWGSPGVHRLVVRLVQGEETALLLEEDVAVPYPIEVVDTVVRMRFTVAKPGPVFLESLIEGDLLGRRALYFAVYPPGLDPRDPVAAQEASRKQVEGMNRCVDPYLDNNTAALAYWSVCQKAQYEPTLLQFQAETQAVYWKDYPLPFRTTFAAGFRTRPGKHRVRIDLVHASTRAVTPGTTAEVLSDSSMSIVRIHGEVIVRIPEPGWYFFNLYVDDTLIGSSMICAETDKVKYSYGLLPQDVARVAAGELLVLNRRGQSLDELARSLESMRSQS